MAFTETQRGIVYQQLRDLAYALDAAPHGKKTSIKQQLANQFGWSLQKLHRELKKIGWDSGRKRRSDAGTTEADETTLQEIATMIQAGMRKNGKQTMHITTARSILAQNGRKITISNARLSVLLRQMNMDAKTMKTPSATKGVRSKHQNHVHEIDPSLCLIYYAPNGEQKVLHDDEIYKNKPGWVKRVGNLKCWRYVLTDHYSSTIIVRYYQSAGENQTNLYDFMLYCWQKMEGRPFHGMPKICYMDKGSANTAKALKNALTSLGVEVIGHEQGNARATGQVENAQNIVETQFESRLKYEPVNSVDELNESAEWWYNAWNANAIPDYDSRLKRRGMAQPMARYGIWQAIWQQHLRLLPDLELCRYLLVHDPVVRKVNGYNEISFVHPSIGKSKLFDVSHIPEIHPRMEVEVQPLIGDKNGILVTVTNRMGEKSTYECLLAEIDELSGFRMDSPVIGEGFAQLPDSTIETNKKSLDKLAYGDLEKAAMKKAKQQNAQPFFKTTGSLNAHSHLKNASLPAYMNRPGSEVDVPNRVQVAIKPLTIIQAKRSLVRHYDIVMDAENDKQIRHWYPEGVPEDELAGLAERLLEQPIQLKVVGGNERG